MGPTNKKNQNEDWMKDAIPVSDEEWMANAVPVSDEEWNANVGSVGPDLSQLDASEDAPWNVRMSVGALDKPEDRLTALRKTYPDAQPDPEDPENNFIFTDPETGKVRRYNTPSWIPNWGDFTSIAPEAGEGIGSILGAAGGAVGGGIVGSAVPVIGTGAGAVGGAITGAGAGGVAGREATQRGLNWIFGNEDTRTGKEQAVDMAQTFALNAAGEGVGRAVAAGGSAAIRGGKKLLGVADYSKLDDIVGAADDVAKAAQRADDLRAVGVDPTAGMVAGNSKAAQAEHALLPTAAGNRIQSRINDAFAKQGDEFERIVSGISSKPLSKAEAGEALRAQANALKGAAKAETDRLYTETKTLATAPAVVDATANFMQTLQAERAGLGKWSAKTNGKQADDVISHAADIVEEARASGWDFEKLKNARTTIGKMANDAEDTASQGYLNGLRDALTADMEATANAAGPDAVASWKKAEGAYKERISPETGYGKGGAGYTLTDTKIDTDKLADNIFSDKTKGGNKIAATRRMIEKDDAGKQVWRNTIAGDVDRMGRGANGEFNGTQFFREWNKLSPEAKNAAFNGTDLAGYRADLDRLSRIADNMKKYNRAANLVPTS